MASDKSSRHTRRHNVSDFKLSYAKSSFFSFLSKSGSKQDLPVVNLNSEGLQFLSDKSFKRGDRLKLSLAHPGEKNGVEVQAEVRWCRQVPRRNAYRVGVLFRDPDSEAENRLKNLEEQIHCLTISAVCQGCSQVLAVSKEHEGKRVQCPHCATKFTLHDTEVLPKIESEHIKPAKTQEDPVDSDDADFQGPFNKSRGTIANVPLDLSRFIHRAVKGRLYLDLIKHFASRKENQVCGVAELGKRFNVTEKRVTRVLRHLVGRGVLKEIGIKTYSYSPIPGPVELIPRMLTALKNPNQHTAILSAILESETSY
jgi:DNA-directed RNA polymerase subunit M/transcription elongation factor TFIIS